MKNLVGERHGMLKVIEKLPVAEGEKVARWLCHCDCGGTTKAYAANLREDGGIKHCGCQRGKSLRKNTINIGGKTYGDLAVVERLPVTEGESRSRWLCRCKCGNEIKVYSANLRNGSVKRCNDCSSLKHEPGANLFEQRFGTFTAKRRLERNGKYYNEFDWLCRCDCGNEQAINAVFLSGPAQKKTCAKCRKP